MNMHKAKRKSPIGPAVAGFTLMELMVSIGILVIIILSVGMTFSGVSKSVGTSQATMEEMAAVRATQRLIERDIQAMDRDGFLVIATRMNKPFLPANRDRTYRFDQLSFLTRGEFPNHTGANTNSPFTDSSTANAEHVWWGQGVMEKDASAKPDISYAISNQSQATARPALPTGVSPAGTLINENECTLLRHATLMFPGPASGTGEIFPAGQSVMAYPGLELGMSNVTGIEKVSAHITSSRYAVAAVTPADVMRLIAYERQGNTSPFANVVAPSGAPEYDFYTYRFRALDSVYDTEVPTNPFVNGYFRTTPIVMRGVSSFRVEWTDGSVFPPNGYGGYPPPDALGRAGQVKWYGPSGHGNGGEMLYGGTNSAVANFGTDNTKFNTNVELTTTQLNNAGYGDDYVAVFGPHNKALWPKALRITIHVANERLGGRDFVQVVDLPH
jgi:type II secretory pathway pseudopilin PulG